MIKYKVKDGKQIRLREADKVTAYPVGTLASGEVFDAEIVRDDATGLWVKVAEKRFGAVRDAKGEVFADVVSEPDPDPTNKLVTLTVTIEGEGYQSVTVDLLPND